MPDQNDDKPKGPWEGKIPIEEEREQILADHKVWLDKAEKPGQRPPGDPPQDLQGVGLSNRPLKVEPVAKLPNCSDYGVLRLFECSHINIICCANRKPRALSSNQNVVS